MCSVCCQRSKDYSSVLKPRMHSSEAGWRSSCSRFKHCAMHSAIRSPTLNPIGAIGLRATDDDLSDRSGRAEFDPLYQPRPWPEGCGLYLAFRIRCEGLCGVRKNVLVVAQQIELRARIARVLHSAGYGVELAGNQKRALELATRKDIQAAIVVHSTDLVGLGQKLRGKIPTTILVGHRTDQIVRPDHSLQGTDASLDEQKLLDRLSASPGSKRDETVPAPVKIEDCKLDLAGHTFVDGSGREVGLTRAETALLTAFVDSPRRVLSRDQLRYAVAGRGAELYDRSVDMLVARLRRKIEPDPKAPRFILSVPGVGYKFDVPVVERRESRSPASH